MHRGYLDVRQKFVAASSVVREFVGCDHVDLRSKLGRNGRLKMADEYCKWEWTANGWVQISGPSWCSPPPLPRQLPGFQLVALCDPAPAPGPSGSNKPAAKNP